MKITNVRYGTPQAECLLCCAEDLESCGFSDALLLEIRRQLSAHGHAFCPSLGMAPYVHVAVLTDIVWDNANGVRRRFGKCMQMIQAAGVESLYLQLPESCSADQAGIALQGCAQGAYCYDMYLSKKKPCVQKLWVRSAMTGARVRKEVCIVESINNCRDLINIPAEDMGPDQFVARARTLCRGTGIKLTVMNETACKRAGMGALLAVGRASPRKPRLLMLEYNAAKGKSFHAICGKGVCFDTGGLGIKPSAGMQVMRKDMGGAATVLTAFVAAANNGLKKSVRVYIPLAENNIDSTAFRPGDILTAMDGTTIEVGHTDAEGRLILADAMCQARSDGARSIATVATLTGAALVALGRIHVPIMGDDAAHINLLTECATRSGEKVWQLPLDDDHTALNRSPYADLSNAGTGEAGCIGAGAFLWHFAGGLPFMHCDISPSSWQTSAHDLGQQGATGVLVHSLCAYMLALK